MMFAKLTDRLLRPVAKFWRDKGWAMKRVGIDRLRSFAKRYNHWRYSDRARLHQDAFENGFEALLRENGTLATFPPRIKLSDGWAREDSHSLPYLERVLDQAREIVRTRRQSAFGDAAAVLPQPAAPRRFREVPRHPGFHPLV